MGGLAHYLEDEGIPTTQIALIRKHERASESNVTDFLSRNADLTVQNNVTNKTTYARGMPPGTIIDAPSGTTYEAPISSVDPSRVVAAYQAELRAIGARLTMPEYMISGDASNANFASTQVAESPAMVNFCMLQGRHVPVLRKVQERVIESGERMGLLPAGTSELVSVQGEPVDPVVRNATEETNRRALLNEIGAMSMTTLQLQEDLDPETERRNMDLEQGSGEPLAMDDGGEDGDDESGEPDASAGDMDAGDEGAEPEA